MGIVEFIASQQYSWNQQTLQSLANWISSPSCSLNTLVISSLGNVKSIQPIIDTLFTNTTITKFKANSIPCSGFPAPSEFIKLINTATSQLIYVNCSVNNEITCSEQETAEILSALKANSRIQSFKLKDYKVNYKYGQECSGDDDVQSW